MGDIVYTQDIKDSNNTSATDKKGYNGYYEITGVPNNMEFQYSNTDTDGDKKNTGNYIDETSNRVYSLPRFSVNDNKEIGRAHV